MYNSYTPLIFLSQVQYPWVWYLLQNSCYCCETETSAGEVKMIYLVLVNLAEWSGLVTEAPALDEGWTHQVELAMYKK